LSSGAACDSFAAQQDAAEIKLRAERRLGEMLTKQKMDEGGNFVLPPDVVRIASSRWQRIAALPKAKFENYIAEARDRKDEVTFAGAGCVKGKNMKKWLYLARREAERTGMLPTSEVKIDEKTVLEADAKNVTLSLFDPRSERAMRSRLDRDEVERIRDALSAWLETGDLQTKG
jgi:hypothetical protein